MGGKKTVIYLLGFACILGLISFAEKDDVAAEIPAAPDATQSALPAPELSPEERLSLAIPPVNVYRKDLDRLVYGNQLDWPEMRYLHEGANLLGRTITPVDYRIIPAGDTVKAYIPADDEVVPDAILYIEEILEQGFRPAEIDGVFIPPGGSLVMIQIDVEPPMTKSDETCGSSYEGPHGDSFRIAYPDLGEHPIAYTPIYPNSGGYKLGEFAAPFADCLDDGWLYFYLPTLEADPAEIWLEFVQTENGYDDITGEPYSDTTLSFWTLTERP
jgi:hypothetical protein